MKILNKLGIEGEDKPFQLLLCFASICDGLSNIISIWFGYRVNLSLYLATKHYKKQFEVLTRAQEIIDKEKKK